MRRHLFRASLFVLTLLALGCLLSPSRHITGTVTYPGGQLAVHAQVATHLLEAPPGSSTTYTDTHGHYSLNALPEGDTVYLWATDATTSGVRGVTNSGTATVVMGHDGATQDIVLNQANPI